MFEEKICIEARLRKLTFCHGKEIVLGVLRVTQKPTYRTELKNNRIETELIWTGLRCASVKPN